MRSKPPIALVVVKEPINVPSDIGERQQLTECLIGEAEYEDWLTNNFDEISYLQVTAAQDDDAEATVAETEEHVLRFPGPAVISQWNTIPMKLRRKLFDTAGSMRDVLKSVLR